MPPITSTARILAAMISSGSLFVLSVGRWKLGTEVPQLVPSSVLLLRCSPVVEVTALVAVVPPLLFTQDWGTWVYRGLAILLIGCPCALVISTPAAIAAGLSAGARRLCGARGPYSDGILAL